MFPFFQLREAEALLLSTTWFTDFYLDISGGLGTFSTVSEFPSIQFHGVVGSGLSWPAPTHFLAQNNIHYVFKDWYAVQLSADIISASFQWLNIPSSKLCILRKEQTTTHCLAGWLASCFAWLCRCPTSCPLSPINPPNTPWGSPSRTTSWVICLPTACGPCWVRSTDLSVWHWAHCKGYYGDVSVVHPELHEFDFYWQLQ